MIVLFRIYDDGLVRCLYCDDIRLDEFELYNLIEWCKLRLSEIASMKAKEKKP